MAKDELYCWRFKETDDDIVSYAIVILRTKWRTNFPKISILNQKRKCFIQRIIVIYFKLKMIILIQ